MSNVQLVVYDLSQGMARQLSAQFLGGPQYAIDIIPHTAIVVFGREYFFGGGIQHEDPQQFRRLTGMYPIQTLALGTTTVSRAEFEVWCETVTRTGRYTAASYDLLERNCNNFTHDAAREGLRLPQGVPEWILQVPRRFLSSPMGQIVRPMLQNMQVTGGSGGNAAPFSGTPTSSFGGATSLAASESSLERKTNPWAMSSETASAKEPQHKSPASTSTGVKVKTPTLDAFDKHLVSKDTKTVALCVKKVAASLEDDTQQQTLHDIGTALTGNIKLAAAQVDLGCSILYQNVFSSDDNARSTGAITFALMFLRMLVLQADDSLKESSMSYCVDWICQQLQAPRDQTHLSSTASRTMAYLVLANVASLPGIYEMPSNMIDSTLLVDWAVSSQPRPEVRQAASALAYNYVLSDRSGKDEDDGIVSDEIVSLLCASLEGLEGETDGTTLLRRVLVAARILRPVSGSSNETIQSLVLELGFVDTLQNLASKDSNNNDDTQCQLLAKELISMLRQ